MSGLKKGDASSPLFFSFALEYPIRRVRVKQGDLKLNSHINIWFMVMMLIYWAEAYIL